MQSEQKFSISPKSAAVITTLAGLSLGMAARPAEAALEPNGSNDADYIAMGSQYAGKSVWFQATTPSGKVFEGSAVRLNSEWALTAAHNVVGPIGTNTFNLVGNGANYLTAPGTTRAVSSVIVDPSYNGTFESPDLALIHLASSLPGTDLNIGPAPSVNAIVTSVGFGNFGTPATGVTVNDGNSRGWNAEIFDGVPPNVSSTYYLTADFDKNDHVPLNGKGIAGDSGGPVFDALGDLVGVNIAQTGGTDQIGDTEFLNLDQADTKAWIEANTAIPEPTSLATLVFAGAALLRRRRNV